MVVQTVENPEEIEVGNVLKIASEAQQNKYFIIVQKFHPLEEVDVDQNAFKDYKMLHARLVYNEPGEKMVVEEGQMIKGHFASMTYLALQV